MSVRRRPATADAAGSTQRSAKPPVRYWRREAIVVSGVGLILAIAMIWIVPPYAVWILSAGAIPPAIPNPMDTITGDIGDPTAQAWLLAWTGHALLRNDADLWRTNAFYPEPSALAFSDSLLGYAPFGMIGSGVDAAVLRYNILLVLSFALASVGAYALTRQLGANRVAAAVAGAAFAYVPWRYGHDGHLNILSTGGIPLALAMLIRGHGYSMTRGQDWRRAAPGWVIAGWVVAAWQISLGFAVGLAFVYVLFIVCSVAGVRLLIRDRRLPARSIVLANLCGGFAFAAVTLYFARRYAQMRDLYPETERPWDYVALFSPPARGLVTAPRSSLPWGNWHEGARQAFEVAANEKVLLCGFVLYALALLGLFISAWTVRQRAWLGAGVVLGTMIALGTNGPLYWLLYLYVPGFDGSRTPGRLIIWPTVLLIILAAGAVTELARRASRAAVLGRARALSLGLTVPLLVLVLMEGLPNMDHPRVPVGPSAAMAAAPTPFIVLPSDEGIDLNVMLWSTDRFPTMVNGGSSINPAGHQAIRDIMLDFPSTNSVSSLRRLGIRSVVIDNRRIADSTYQNIPHATLAGTGVSRRDVGGDHIYILD